MYAVEYYILILINIINGWCSGWNWACSGASQRQCLILEMVFNHIYSDRNVYSLDTPKTVFNMRKGLWFQFLTVPGSQLGQWINLVRMSYVLCDKWLVPFFSLELRMEVKCLWGILGWVSRMRNDFWIQIENDPWSSSWSSGWKSGNYGASWCMMLFWQRLQCFSIFWMELLRSAETMGNLLNPISRRYWRLCLFPINEEFPVSMGRKLMLIKPLPIEHTVPREYRSGGLVRSSDQHSRDWS